MTKLLTSTGAVLSQCEVISGSMRSENFNQSFMREPAALTLFWGDRSLKWNSPNSEVS